MMKEIDTDEMQPVFYGSTTVGERGQVVIPAEVRKDMGITPNTKLLVFGGPNKNIMILAKSEFLSGFMTKITDIINQIKEQD